MVRPLLLKQSKVAILGNRLHSLVAKRVVKREWRLGQVTPEVISGGTANALFTLFLLATRSNIDVQLSFGCQVGRSHFPNAIGFMSNAEWRSVRLKSSFQSLVDVLRVLHSLDIPSSLDFGGRRTPSAILIGSCTILNSGSISTRHSGSCFSKRSPPNASFHGY
jgi:hypothetical protein